VLLKPKARSRITNNKELLPGIDARSVWLRRFRDLNALLATDCGNGALSNGQLAIIRRASALAVEFELLEAKFARNHGATREQLEIYIRAANSLRRMCECLGIHTGKIARDITPSLAEYLNSRSDTRPRVQPPLIVDTGPGDIE
jgi:hypothetical protein